ncbi:MAG TPA: glycosyltransferase family 2 protein [Vicinamibacterales bacterium]|nr:glycosyltransferase family 2 protein [Vicinamibacterales bacterium]
MGPPALSIVIVSYNARRELAGCLDSLDAHPPGLTAEVVVVDNASPDGSADVVEARGPRVRLIRLARNAGFAAANNVGIRATSGDLILLLNSDTLVGPGSIDTLAARLRAHPTAAAAGPRLVDGDGRAELSFGPMISPFAELRQKVVMALHRREFPPISTRVERATSREQFVDWVSGAALLVRRADAEAVGLLDERFFLYTEDVDFCAALRARGRRILFAPAAVITHLRGRSRASARAAMNAAYRRSQLAFYRKHHPRWAPALRLYLRMKGQLPRE